MRLLPSPRLVGQPTNPFRLFCVLLPLALFVSACGTGDPSDAAGPDVTGTTPPGALPDEPTLPGGSAIDISLASDVQFRELSTRVAEVTELDGDGLLAQYPVSFHKELGYDPATSEFLDLIQDSALGLNDSELGVLGTSGFVVSKRQSFPTFLRGYAAVYSEDLPVYITADALLDAVHRSYDKILLAIENQVLIPDLRRLLEQMLAALPAASADAETKADAEMYLAVALSLLTQEPPASTDPRVASFIEQATQANGVANVEFFGGPRLLDFSQFTPRGHYTDDPRLEGYFRSMMWLGRVDLRLLETLTDGSQVFHRNQYETTLLLHELLTANDNMELWSGIDLVIRTFVGESDYMVVPEVDQLVADLGGPEAAKTSNDEVVATAIAQGGYGEQQIASHLMVNDGSVKTLPLNRSFLVFGQRYIVDSHVFSQVVYDRVHDRMMPTPLDAAFAALGNNQALPLNQTELTSIPAYAGALGKMRVLVDAHEEPFWDANFYNLWLTALRTLSQPDPVAVPGLPSIARTEAWGRRLLNTQLGSFAQLRHDTLLYAKQSYTGIPACEFPDAYVDPYPEFYAALQRYAERGAEIIPLLSRDTYLAEAIANYFDNLRNAASVLAAMATQQREGAPHTQDQLAFINDAVRVDLDTAGCATVEIPNGWYARLFFDEFSSIEMDMTIADVHTQPADEAGSIVGRILHVGTALPRLMVTTVDTCVGPRAYVGLVFSYHERITQDFERLTDEQWSQDVLATPPPDVPWLEDVLGE